MENSDFILKWTEDLKAERNLLTFKEDDLRSDYFGLTYDVALNFYKGLILYDFSHFINKGLISFDKKIFDYKSHVDRIAEIVKHPILTASHINSLNRRFTIDSWSVFELCVTSLSAALASPEETEKLLNHQYNDILKKIKSTKLTDSENSDIKKLLVKEHLTHVPITRKTDLLFKKSKGYSRNEKNDKEFLKFLGKFRNTMHTNYIYYGNDYEFKYGDAHFVFKNEKTVVWLDPFPSTPKLFFYIIGNLKAIWKELIITIPSPEFIPYPDLSQE
ncbi:MAG: hypothetical protein IPP32_14470 [Bacteroidetes bacterium]|nr:hypothetical protein [Bacteroidota bacterium]